MVLRGQKVNQEKVLQIRGQEFNVFETWKEGKQ